MNMEFKWLLCDVLQQPAFIIIIIIILNPLYEPQRKQLQNISFFFFKFTCILCKQKDRNKIRFQIFMDFAMIWKHWTKSIPYSSLMVSCVCSFKKWHEYGIWDH